MGNFDTKIAKIKTALENIFLKKTDAADTYQPKGNYAAGNHTHTTGSITDFPTLATVATSGSYSDLSNKPTLSSLSTQSGELTIDDIQDLHSLVLTHFSSADATINLTGGVSNKTAQLKLHRVGQIVYYKLYAYYSGSTFNGTNWASKTVNTGNSLASQYRPKDDYVVHMNNYGDNEVYGMAMLINTSGTVNLYCHKNTKEMFYYCSGTYICNYTYTE